MWDWFFKGKDVISLSCLRAGEIMVRKKGKKSRRRLINLRMHTDVPDEEKPKRKGKKRIRKPKMPARIKKNQMHRKKM